MKYLGFTSRSFRFQLTALVDLLLIIVFMQFLELRQHQEDQQKRYKQELLAIKAESTAKQDQALAAQVVLRSALDESTSALNELKVDLESSQTNLTRVLSAVQAAFAKTKDAMEADASEATAQQLRSLSNASPDQIARFLVGYDELLKRAEVWTLHARSSGEIVLKVADNVRTFRLEAERQSQREQEFADRLYAAYKQVPQPKGLVIILASYDLRATAGIYQGIIDGLPKAIDRLRTDALSTRFEYTILGPTSDPLIAPTKQP